ncbi:unnamed protein product [Orchesella dallaii]|uniref:Polymerase nucleotidyl transferase domain-containing protein n=1 Tax=Orchesella dallaii TaxID=48710 RepID=A0ABP1S689_9HEXA
MGRISKSEARARLDSSLLRFGESLKCEDEYGGEAKRLVDKLFRTLQEHLKNTKYALASAYIGGSFGKKTDVIEPDLDLVLLINKYNPAEDYDQMLDDIIRILRENEQDLKIFPSSYNRTNLSVNFRFLNGISVDLLPAANLKWNVLLKKMEEDEKFAYFFRPSCINEQIELMKIQDSFTHSLARIAKFWFKSLYLEDGFTGGSAMMELLAIEAAQKERKQENTSAIRAFRRILGMVQNLNKIRLAFCKKESGDWKRVPGGRITRNSRSRTVKFPNYAGTGEILQRPRFIIDPANPFSDFLEDKEEHLLQQLKEFSKIADGRLNRILNKKKKEFILELFEPPPRNLALEKSLALPVDYFVSSIDPYEGAIYSKVKVRNDILMKNEPSRRAVEVIKQHVLTIVYSIANGNLGSSAVNVETAVSKWITENHQAGKNKRPPITKHKQVDVTLQIPFKVTLPDLRNPVEKQCAIFVSMNWME